MNHSMNTTGLATLLLMVLLASVGCGTAGSAKVTQVDAQYLGLENRSVAIIVSTSDATSFNFPNARPIITGEITRRVAANVPGVTVSDPQAVLAWQDANPYWRIRPASQLVRQLNVDRLVLVEIGEYRTHEAGDRHVLRGVITATVNIIEAEAPDPDNFGASYTLDAMYPEPSESRIGRIGEGEEQVEFMTQIRFCEYAAGLFFDHEIVR